MVQIERPEPSLWVRRFVHLVRPGGAVLDLACGSGRHTVLLSGAGFQVTAVDRDISKLGHAASMSGVRPVEADLEDGTGWPFPGVAFDAVVVTNYLHRPLFPSILQALSSGGVLIYETFASGNQAFGRPSNPDFLLQPGELLDVVSGALSVVAYEHGTQQTPRPAVVQRLVAVNGAPPFSLEPR
ncbi:MAG: class I SAM-dependent methyltransferase [Pseudomonadota bacterium]